MASVCISDISNLNSRGVFTNSVQRTYIYKKIHKSAGTLALASLESVY